jgi:hypothetical protein
MKPLLVVAIVVATALTLGVVAALVVGPSPARSVPAIELVTTSSTAPATTTTGGAAGERAAPATPGRDDGPGHLGAGTRRRWGQPGAAGPAGLRRG